MSIRKSIQTALLLATTVTLAIGCRDLLAWMRQSDMMFDHYTGPPELILSANFWFKWSVGLAVAAVCLLAGNRVLRRRRSRRKESRSIWVAIVSFGVWAVLLCGSIVLLSVTAMEVPYAKLRKERETIANTDPRHSDAVRRAADAMESTDWLTRQNAAEAMTKLDEQQVVSAKDQLLTAMQSNEVLVAANAIEAISPLVPEDESLAEQLLITIEEREEAMVRVAAARTLAENKAIATPALLADLDSGEPIRQSRAVFALKLFDDLPQVIEQRLLALLNEQDTSIRIEIARLWPMFDNAYSNELIRAQIAVLADDIDQPDTRLIARLATTGVRAFRVNPHLEDLLMSDQPEVRLAAANALWMITGQSEPLLTITSQMLTGSSSDQRKTILTLQSLGPLAAKQLETIARLEESDDLQVASLARIAVFRIKRENRCRLEDIRSMLQAKSVGTIQQGLYRVEQHGDLSPELIPDVEQLMQHEHIGVVLRAIRALPRMGSDAVHSLDAIKQLKTHGNARVREAASEAQQAIEFLYQR